ncbi:hypothetical protein K438DRAFT_1874293 [Mycena galopus ATCC 62051]|nr:hypothetical protein K438DRAFT_1874293 [Mycena galopus ATCC 62051]
MMSAHSSTVHHPLIKTATFRCGILLIWSPQRFPSLRSGPHPSRHLFPGTMMSRTLSRNLHSGPPSAAALHTHGALSDAASVVPVLTGALHKHGKSLYRSLPMHTVLSGTLFQLTSSQTSSYLSPAFSTHPAYSTSTSSHRPTRFRWIPLAGLCIPVSHLYALKNSPGFIYPLGGYPRSHGATLQMPVVRSFSTSRLTCSLSSPFLRRGWSWSQIWPFSSMHRYQSLRWRG